MRVHLCPFAAILFPVMSVVLNAQTYPITQGKTYKF